MKLSRPAYISGVSVRAAAGTLAAAEGGNASRVALQHPMLECPFSSQSRVVPAMIMTSSADATGTATTHFERRNAMELVMLASMGGPRIAIFCGTPPSSAAEHAASPPPTRER